MDHALTRLPLFRTLPTTERKALAEACEVRRFHRGDIVFEEGRPAETVWVVARGCVHLLKRTPQGGSATIFAITPSEPLCGISAFDRGTYAASAVAATDTQLIAIPADRFAGLLDRHPAFAHQVLLTTCDRIRHLAQALSLAQAPVDERVAYVLLRLARSFGDTIPITHHELASMAGIRWETSIRTLSAMKRLGWVSSARGRITLLAPERLRDIVPVA